MFFPPFLSHKLQSRRPTCLLGASCQCYAQTNLSHFAKRKKQSFAFPQQAVKAGALLSVGNAVRKYSARSWLSAFSSERLGSALLRRRLEGGVATLLPSCSVHLVIVLMVCDPFVLKCFRITSSQILLFALAMMPGSLVFVVVLVVVGFVAVGTTFPSQSSIACCTT